MRWFKDHAWWILLIVVGVVGFVFARMTRSKEAGTLEQLRKDLLFEKEIINEKARVAKLRAKMSHDSVLRQIKSDHAARIQELDKADQRQIQEWHHDPEALMEHLLRISS